MILSCREKGKRIELTTPSKSQNTTMDITPKEALLVESLLEHIRHIMIMQREKQP